MKALILGQDADSKTTIILDAMGRICKLEGLEGRVVGEAVELDCFPPN